VHGKNRASLQLEGFYGEREVAGTNEHDVETMVKEVLVLETQSTLRGMMSRRVTRSDETLVARLLVDDDSTRLVSRLKVTSWSECM